MKIYVLGDSISVHYGPFLEQELQGWCNYARKGGPDAAGTDWENPADANGGDSNLVRSFLTENLAAIQSDWLLFNCGLHDLRVERTTGKFQVTIAAYRENLAAIIPLVRQHKIEPIWITTTPLIDEIHNRHDLPYRRFRRDVIAYNQVAAEVMATHNVPIIDLLTFTRNLEPDIYLDHVHLVPDVREQQAAFIARELRQRFTKSPTAT
mgnify:CR=1 FL=1